MCILIHRWGQNNRAPEFTCISATESYNITYNTLLE